VSEPTEKEGRKGTGETRAEMAGAATRINRDADEEKERCTSSLLFSLELLRFLEGKGTATARKKKERGRLHRNLSVPRGVT